MPRLNLPRLDEVSYLKVHYLTSTDPAEHTGLRYLDMARTLYELMYRHPGFCEGQWQHDTPVYAVLDHLLSQVDTCLPQLEGSLRVMEPKDKELGLYQLFLYEDVLSMRHCCFLELCWLDWLKIDAAYTSLAVDVLALISFNCNIDIYLTDLHDGAVEHVEDGVMSCYGKEYLAKAKKIRAKETTPEYDANLETMISYRTRAASWKRKITERIPRVKKSTALVDILGQGPDVKVIDEKRHRFRQEVCSKLTRYKGKNPGRAVYTDWMEAGLAMLDGWFPDYNYQYAESPLSSGSVMPNSCIGFTWDNNDQIIWWYQQNLQTDFADGDIGLGLCYINPVEKPADVMIRRPDWPERLRNFVDCYNRFMFHLKSNLK